ncbi:parafibromin-like [Watersipora subatra]|uniref:parafibromin-like n=1 Tax=Watersipora subatra TaxID=2589382 RepID=UPI00355C5C94
MADVLSVIREYNVSKKDIEERDNLVIFGDKAWQKTAKTNYVAYGTGKESVAKEYYTVDCILFLLKNVHLPHAMYVRQAAGGNVPVVRRPDRKDLLSYLNAETNTSGSIDKSAPLEIPISAPKPAPVAPAKRQADESSTHENKRQKFEEEKVQRDKERLAAKLDGPKTTTTAIPQQGVEKSSISSMLTMEQIAAMKAKRLATKRTTIKADEEPSAFEQRSFVDAEVAVSRDIISKERLWRTRVTVLQSNGKQFAQNIFGILASLKAREEGKQSSAPSSHTTAPHGAPPKVNQPPTYNRYEQESFKQKEETDEFRIDVTKTFQGASLKSVTEGVSTGRKAVEQPRPVPRPVSEARPIPSNKKTSRTPIIIIPAATTSLIQMINAKDILQDYKYVSAEQKRKEGAKRDNEVLIQRKRGDVTIPYRVIDNPLKLQHHDWDRVVAVFVQGPAWQFKSWPWPNPTDIFSRMKGFHMHLKDMPVEANVKKWDVTILALDRHRRHLDRANLQRFWEILDRFVTKNKSHLRI